MKYIKEIKLKKDASSELIGRLNFFGAVLVFTISRDPFLLCDGVFPYTIEFSKSKKDTFTIEFLPVHYSACGSIFLESWRLFYDEKEQILFFTGASGIESATFPFFSCRLSLSMESPGTQTLQIEPLTDRTNICL